MRRIFSVLIVGLVYVCLNAAPSQAAPCTTELVPGDDVVGVVNSASPGDVVCLHTGSYSGGEITASGSMDGGRIVVRSYPGEIAQVNGRIVVWGSWIRLTGLYLDGQSSLPSPTVLGDFVTLNWNDITNAPTICVNAGYTSGRADFLIVAHNRIHDCGTDTNHDHGIYLDVTFGAQVYDNWILGNAARGIQLYPDADFSSITRNLVELNRTGIVISSGSEPEAPCGQSEGNRIFGNVFRDNALLDADHFYGCGIPTGDRFVDNCADTLDLDNSIYQRDNVSTNDPSCVDKLPRLGVGPEAWAALIAPPAALTDPLP